MLATPEHEPLRPFIRLALQIFPEAITHLAGGRRDGVATSCEIVYKNPDDLTRIQVLSLIDGLRPRFLAGGTQVPLDLLQSEADYIGWLSLLRARHPVTAVPYEVDTTPWPMPMLQQACLHRKLTPGYKGELQALAWNGAQTSSGEIMLLRPETTEPWAWLYPGTLPEGKDVNSYLQGIEFEAMACLKAPPSPQAFRTRGRSFVSLLPDDGCGATKTKGWQAPRQPGRKKR